MLSENMKILAFTGMPWSGKSEAVKIAKSKKVPIIRMGDLVWDETKKQGLDLNDKNVGFVANNMREKHGKDIWSKKTIEKIKSMRKKDTIIIDGIRNPEEIDLFKKELGSDFVIIAIKASDEIRRKRALSRGRIDDSDNIKELEIRDKRELGWGLGKVLESADIAINNEGKIEEFRGQVRDILDKL